MIVGEKPSNFWLTFPIPVLLWQHSEVPSLYSMGTVALSKSSIRQPILVNNGAESFCITFVELLFNVSIWTSNCGNLWMTETFVWRELRTSGQKIIPRAGHTTVALSRHLFVFGGFTDDRKLFDDLHVLNVGAFPLLNHVHPFLKLTWQNLQPWNLKLE